LRHNKPPLPNVWPFNLVTNIIQCKAETFGQTSFILVHGAPFVTPTTEFNELCIILGVAPNMKNGHKIRMRQCLPMIIARMKDATTLDAKVVNISFTPQGHIYIYELLVHESIVNNLPCTYFVTIGVFPSCICPDFVSIVASYRHNYFLSYKHMYYIYNVCLKLVGDNQTH
jgi:hypothetical protein